MNIIYKKCEGYFGLILEALKKCEVIERGKKLITDEKESNVEKSRLSLKEMRGDAELKTKKVKVHIEGKATKDGERY